MDRRNALTLLTIACAVPSFAMAKEERMGEAEREHAMQTLAIGSVALQTAGVAEKNATNAWVKKFAQYEVAEQTTIAEILKSMGAEPAKLTEKQAAVISKTRGASPGTAFDEDFLSNQLEGHKDLLKVQEAYIEKGKNEAAVNLSKLARAQIKEHIDLIETIQKQAKG